MRILIAFLAILLLFSSGTVSVSGEGQGSVLLQESSEEQQINFSTTASSSIVITSVAEPSLLSKASQDKQCRQWVDSLMNKLSLKEKVGQLFIYTIAPVGTKRSSKGSFS